MEQLEYPEESERRLPAERDDVNEIISRHDDSRPPSRSELHSLTNNIVREIENDLGIMLEGELESPPSHTKHERRVDIRAGTDIHEVLDGARYGGDGECTVFQHPITYSVSVTDLNESNVPDEHDYQLEHRFTIERERRDGYENPVSWKDLVNVYGEPDELSQGRLRDRVKFIEEV